MAKAKVTPVKVESPFDSRSLISLAFNSVLGEFNVKRNPINGNKLITNPITQTLADNAHTFEVSYLLKGGNVKLVKRSNWIPSRNEQGEKARDLARETATAYRTGLQKNSDKECEKELWSLLSFFIVCCVRGQLPTPEKRSGASTIRSRFVDFWLKRMHVKIDSVVLVGSKGQRITYGAKHVNNILETFRINADDILANWDTSIGGQTSTDFKVRI